MEHRLILGGERYLPFARSCVAKLKKLGLPYADQSYEVDGVSVKVRIEPGHEYIRIEGGQQLLPMDSGVVKIGLVGPFVETTPPGVLFEAGKALAYNQKFMLTKPGDVWRTLRAKDSVGQISGKLKKSGKTFAGAVPIDRTTARSFTPMNEQVADSDPATWKDKAYDEEVLLSKMTTVRLCPASMFTGKCRLWVQAMYGQYTFKDQKVPNSAKRVNAKPAPPYLAGDGRPALFVPGYKGAGKMWVGPSTGVHLDRLTGKHWAFALANKVCQVFPLVSDASGEAARGFLVEGKGKDLTPDDLHNLEAHILSTARPDVAAMQTIDLNREVLAWSLGYGWHWNWDGTAADVVINNQFDQDPTVSIYAFPKAMRSTHWRFTIERKASGVGGTVTWGGAVSVIESADWAVKRHSWVIAEPDWTSGQMIKLTPAYTDMFECNAPFYAFYKKNELQMCRVKVEKVAGKEGYRETSAPYINGSYYADPWFGGGIYENALGETSGFCHDSVESEYFQVTFSVGDISTAPLPLQHTKSTQYSVGKVGGVSSPATYGGYPIDAGMSPCGQFRTGYPNEVGEYEMTTVCAPDGNITTSGWNGPYRYFMVTAGHKDTERYGMAVAVAPFNDAEALFLRAHIQTTVSEVDTHEDVYSVIGLEREIHYYFPVIEYIGDSKIVTGHTHGGHTTYYGFSSTAIGGVLISSEPSSAPSKTTISGEVKKLISKADVELTDFSMSFYFADTLDDAVASRAEALSGTSTEHPIVVSNKRTDSVGLPDDISDSTGPVIVGWV